MARHLAVTFSSIVKNAKAYDTFVARQHFLDSSGDFLWADTEHPHTVSPWWRRCSMVCCSSPGKPQEERRRIVKIE
jgi:hypothetical protein